MPRNTRELESPRTDVEGGSVRHEEGTYYLDKDFALTLIDKQNGGERNEKTEEEKLELTRRLFASRIHKIDGLL